MALGSSRAGTSVPTERASVAVRPGDGSTTMFSATLVRGDHTRTFDIRPVQPEGWEASEHDGQRLVRRQHCSDWHRVERTLERYAQEIAQLKEHGWQ
jgi:hypothetical protein